MVPASYQKRVITAPSISTGIASTGTASTRIKHRMVPYHINLEWYRFLANIP